MFTDSDITQATQTCAKLRNHVASMAYAAKPTDAALNALLATVDQLGADLLAQRKSIEGR